MYSSEGGGLAATGTGIVIGGHHIGVPAIVAVGVVLVLAVIAFRLVRSRTRQARR